MRLEKLSVLISLIIILVSCNKDDESNTPITPPRDRGEQQIEDDASIQDYLRSHYYNSEELLNLPDASISDIKITPLEEGETEPPAGHTMLIADVEDHDVKFAEADYVYYILRLRQGQGDSSPTFADSVRLLYEGFLFDGDIFDSTPNPITFDLTQLIPGWRKVIPRFKTAIFPPEENGDGTVSYRKGGLGVMFLPSGLAYFNNATTGVSAYTPIMFKFELLQSFENDHDGDGIPSYLEDINGDGEFTAISDNEVADDDTDNDNIPNFFDSDDDNDRVPTRNELLSNTYVINNGDPEPVIDETIEFIISRVVGATTTTIKTLKIVDSNGDELDDHLDDEIKIKNNTF